jgi:integrase
MPRRVPPLNAKQIEKWRPDPARTLELVDGAVPGLRVQLSPFGDLTWSLSVRVHGVRRRIAVGKELKLAEARRKAEQLRAEIASGIDPTAIRKEARARQRAAAKGVGTLESVIKAYFETGPGSALRSNAEAQRMIRRVFVDHLPRPSLDVRSSELQLTIDAYGSKSSAQHAAGYLRPVLKWAAKRGLMIKGDLLEAPPQPSVQQRVLTHVEVGSLWRILGWETHDAAARFMLLTAARCEEACGATWSEIDLERAQWVIPAERRKDTHANTRRGATDHTVPLNRQAVALLERVRAREDSERVSEPSKPLGDALVFTGGRGAKIANWPRRSRNMQKRLGFDVTPHTLRRTCATLAGDLGHPPHVVSALLGHRIGGALHSGYNQSRYRAECALALQQLADLIDSLAAGEDNVVTIASRRT